MPRLTYSTHATERMLERCITEEQIKAVLARPIGEPDAGDPGKLTYGGYVTGGEKPALRVVVSATDRTHVISVMWRDRP